MDSSWPGSTYMLVGRSPKAGVGAIPIPEIVDFSEGGKLAYTGKSPWNTGKAN